MLSNSSSDCKIEIDEEDSQASTNVDESFQAYLKKLQYNPDGGINKQLLSDALGKIEEMNKKSNQLKRSMSAADIELIDSDVDDESEPKRNVSPAQARARRQKLRRQAMSVDHRGKHEIKLCPGSQLVGPVAVATTPPINAIEKLPLITPFTDVAQLKTKISETYGNR